MLNPESCFSFLSQNCYLMGANKSVSKVAPLQFIASITTLQFQVLRAKSSSPPQNRKGKLVLGVIKPLTCRNEADKLPIRLNMRSELFKAVKIQILFYDKRFNVTDSQLWHNMRDTPYLDLHQTMKGLTSHKYFPNRNLPSYIPHIMRMSI
jgi:hypothetical protein